MRNLALTLLLAALLPTTGACASLAEADASSEAPGGSKNNGFGGSGGTAATGGNGGSSAGGAGGPPSSGASGSGDGGGKLADFASEACLSCARALCLDCPAENPSCDPCTVHPWLCGPQETDEASGVFQCVCAGSCASECGESAACAAPVLGGAGAGGDGGMGSENAGAGGMGNGAGAGGNGAGGNDAGGGAGAGAGAQAEDCFNGVSDTPENLIDCANPSCAVVCADPCSTPIALILDEQSQTATHQAVWEGHANAFTQDCASSVKTGPDIVYEITNSSAKAAFVRVSASSKEGDVVLARKDKCSGGSQDIPCQNKVGVAGTEIFEVLVEAGASIFAVVGAAEAGAAGGFSIEAKLIVPSCGDGVVTPDEACDDAQDEGCNSSCQIIACDDATPVDDGKTISVSQKDAKLSTSLQPSCSKLGTSAGEYIHSIRAKHSGWLQAVLRSSDPTDLTLSLWSSCQSGAELACADRASGASGALERLVIPVGSGELHQVVVDSYDALPVAAYELFARSYPAQCGDDVVSPVEQCDGTEACEPDCTSTLAKVDEIEPNEAIPQATPIQPPAFSAKQAALGGRIGQPGDVDLFLLSVPEGGLLEIATDEPGDGSCKRQGFSDSPVGLLDSELRLFTPEGALLAVNDNGPGDGFCSRLKTKVTGGSYLIQVRASSAAPAQVFSYLLRVSLPLSGTSMHPRRALRLAALAGSMLLACGDAGLFESSDDSRCVAAPCSPTLGPGGGAGNGSPGAGGRAGDGVAGAPPAGAGGTGLSGGGTSPVGGSSGGEQSPTEGACAACYQALCEPDGVPGCACAVSRCAQQCGEFLGESCPIPGAGGAGGAGGSDGPGAGAGGSAPGGAGGSGNDPAAEKDCTDTLDNNGSNQVDCEDASCEASCKDMCFDPPSLVLGLEKPGSLQGHTSVFQANCVPVAQLGSSVAYRFEAPEDGWLSLSLSSEGDLALSAHKGECKGGSYSFCRNVVGAGGTEALVVEVKKGEFWFVVLTEGSKTQPGTFTLKATFETPVCGDGKLSSGEQCDDGNVLDGDGCSADCKNDSCDNAPALEDKLVTTQGQAPAPTVASGTLASGVSSLQASCSKLGVTSLERVHAFRAANPGRLEVSVVPTTPGEDLILSVRSSCAPQGELSCADATQGGGPERLSLPAEAGQPFYFVVEGSDASVQGGYELRAQTLPVACGDKILVKSVEQCDVNADEKNCAEGCTRLPGDGDSTGSSAVAKLPASGAAVGRIFPAGDADIFALEILPDQKLRLSVVDPTPAPDCADGRLDSQLELFDGEGALVAFNDDAPASAVTKGYCSELVLDKPGFYTVRVRSSQHSSPAQVFSYKLVAAPL